MWEWIKLSNQKSLSKTIEEEGAKNNTNPSIVKKLKIKKYYLKENLPEGTQIPVKIGA